MGYPIRRFDPQTLYFITNRTFQARLFMTPTKAVRDTVGGCLGKALSHYAIDLFGFVFLSNHYHLIVRATRGQMAQFMNHLNTNLAKKVGKQIGWSGKFWQRRYTATPILDNEALLQRMSYILQHGVKEGLVERSVSWPGLHCIDSLLDSKPKAYPWVNETQLCLDSRKKEGPKPKDEYIEWMPVPLTTLPCWDGLEPQELKKTAQGLLDPAEQEALDKRNHSKCMGATKVSKQDPLSRPTTSKRSPQPLCHTTSTHLRQEFKAFYRTFVENFKETSQWFREQRLEIEFPLYSYPPSLPLRV
jgi:REP element-mobilizing transposase RayT